MYQLWAKYISSCLNLLHLSVLVISHTDIFGDCSMKISVCIHSLLLNMKQFIISQLVGLNWLIVFPSAFQNPVYLPVLTAEIECINSVAHNGIGMQLKCPSLLPCTFSELKMHILWIHNCWFQFVNLNTAKEMIVPVFKAGLMITYMNSMFSTTKQNLAVDDDILITTYFYIMYNKIFFCCSPSLGFNYLVILLFWLLTLCKKNCLWKLLNFVCTCLFVTIACQVPFWWKY